MRRGVGVLVEHGKAQLTNVGKRFIVQLFGLLIKAVMLILRRGTQLITKDLRISLSVFQLHSNRHITLYVVIKGQGITDVGIFSPIGIGQIIDASHNEAPRLVALMSGHTDGCIHIESTETTLGKGQLYILTVDRLRRHKTKVNNLVHKIILNVRGKLLMGLSKVLLFPTVDIFSAGLILLTALNIGVR